MRTHIAKALAVPALLLLAAAPALAGAADSAAVPGTHGVRSGDRFTTVAAFALDGDTTLDDVIDKVGPAPIVETGESGGYRASVCYGAPGAVVSFLSEAAGGDEHRLLGYAITRTGAPLAACGTARIAFVPQELAIGGLELGMSKARFGALLGDVQWDAPDQPGDSSAGGDRSSARRFFESVEGLSDEQRRHFAHVHPDRPLPPGRDVTISILGSFDGDSLVAYEIWKIRHR